LMHFSMVMVDLLPFWLVGCVHVSRETDRRNRYRQGCREGCRRAAWVARAGTVGMRGLKTGPDDLLKFR